MPSAAIEEPYDLAMVALYNSKNELIWSYADYG